MLNKIYEKIKQIIKDNLIFIFSFLIVLFLFSIKLPYYINAPGGIINVKDKVNINYELSGSYNMTYVTEYNANVFNYLLAKVNKNWDIEKKEDVILENESEEDSNKRSHILLESGNQLAILNSYKMAEKNIEIKDTKLYVTYIDSLADTNLKIGDRILKIDEKKVISLSDIAEIINEKEISDEIIIETDNGIKSAKIIELDGNKKIGISISILYEMETDIVFKFKNNESGPSGGLITTLYIYNSLIDEDLTKNRIIAGTGTIEADGSIGEIGGVKYKIIGAVKNKADIFFVPKENYEEALKVKNENNYDIELVSVEKLEEAINYLKKDN